MDTGKAVELTETFLIYALAGVTCILALTIVAAMVYVAFKVLFPDKPEPQFEKGDKVRAYDFLTPYVVSGVKYQIINPFVADANTFYYEITDVRTRETLTVSRYAVTRYRSEVYNQRN